MRVLMLHNRYRFEGGEERAVADIIELLRAHGHTVYSLERSSARLTRRQAAQALVSGGADPEEVAQAVKQIRPDVVHAHNLHPSFGWRALAAARGAGARTVLHVHNFRLFCAIGVAYREGAPCFRCRGADTRPGVRFRCRGSVHEAIVYAVGLHAQQPRIFEHAERFVAVSDASARRLFELGLPADRTHTVRNFLPAASFAPASHAGRGEFALAGGRLVEEKGFDTAVAAARAAKVPLVIAGDGPDLERLRHLAGGDDVRFVGRLDRGAMAEVRGRAGVVLVPSRSEEACPYAALEALADGVPVLASDYGGLPEVVGSEAVVAGRDPRAWAHALEHLWRDPERRQTRGSDALERARALFSQERYFNDLMSVYQS
ncbi:MAG: glycosyltransferase family 4 protein [Solirubrobacterales bacterium]|nr:glycosyltransferase family 4 protein [Solirubrobacterales bacterium]MBV9797967.1 glycosyltransferase family 4 protein [Solirubrobacterales bacterium]